eukprot:sb/3478708/
MPFLAKSVQKHITAFWHARLGGGGGHLCACQRSDIYIYKSSLDKLFNKKFPVRVHGKLDPDLPETRFKRLDLRFLEIQDLPLQCAKFQELRVKSFETHF